MTDSRQITSPKANIEGAESPAGKTSGHLFENEFAYVTSEGEVKLKETEFFEERTLARIDPEAAEEQIETYEKAFVNLGAKVDAFFTDAAGQLEKDPDMLGKQFDQLLKEISEFDAIGDFEALVEEAKDRFEELMASSAPEKAENGPRETDGEFEESGEDVENEPGLEDKSQPGSQSEPEEYYKKLAEKAEQFAELTDWALASMEFDNLDYLWQEGPDPEGADIKKYKEKVDTLRQQFEEKKRAHYEEQKKIRLKNLEKKKDLLEKFKEIIDRKQWTHTKEVGRIKGQWEQIKPVPAEELEKLQATFDNYLKLFDEHKVDRLVKKKQQEEDNLTGKLVILEKMESFVRDVGEKADWNDLEKKFSDLTRQFRKIGRVPIEKNQEVWDRYYNLQETFHSTRFKYDKAYRKKVEKFFSNKKKLIDEAEALIDTDNLADAARRVNKLHRKWKKTGNLPQKEENELWDRFKAATDAFNKKKSENIDLLRKQEDENYSVKLTLIEKAEALKESDQWEETHREFQKLMEQWKNIGPVPKRKSGKIWKKFKKSMDHFYDRRREHFKEIKEERKDNLKEKQELLGKLRDLTTHENPIEAVEQAKPLQEEFKQAGYVPIKHKNRLWKEYRELCDIIYERLRAAQSAAEIVGRDKIDDYSVDDIADIRKKQIEADKLRKKIDKQKSEMIQMKESLSYFKPSGGSGSSLLDDVKKRIEKTEADIADKENVLADLEKEIDMIKK